MIAECPPDVFKAFVEQYIDVLNVTEKQWEDIYMRWRMINFLIEKGVLEVEGERLVEVAESEVPEPAQEGVGDATA